MAGAGQSNLLHSLVAVMLWAVLQAELTVSPVPLMWGSVLNPISSFIGHSPVEFLKLVLINFWKNKERKHLQPHV